jgi:hypothetical protein
MAFILGVLKDHESMNYFLENINTIDAAIYTAYGKIVTSRDKTLNFSAFATFLMNLIIKEKLRPENVYIHAK